MSYDPYQAPASPSVPPPVPFDGQVSERAAQELIGTQGWVRFVSVLMLVATGFTLLGVLLELLGPGSAASGMQHRSDLDRGGYIAGQFIGILLAGLLYLYPAVLLAKYASAIKRFRYGRSMRDFEAALRHQRFFWRFIGIVFCVVLVLFVLLFTLGAGAFVYRAGRF